MRKIISILLVLCMLLSLAACGKKIDEPTSPSEPSIEQTEPTIDNTEPSEPDDIPEIITASSVGEIMSLAQKTLYESECVTMSTFYDKDVFKIQMNNTTGEYIQTLHSESSSYIEEEKLYVVKNDDKYESYLVYTEEDLETKEVYQEAEKMTGRYDFEFDFAFIYSCEPYMTLEKETKIIDDKECYVLTSIDEVKDAFNCDKIQLFITANDYKLVKFVVGDSTNEEYTFNYDEFEAKLPENINENLTISNEEYDNAYQGNFFYSSDLEQTGLSAFDIKTNDLNIAINNKAEFLHTNTDDVEIEYRTKIRIDGLNFDDVPLSSTDMIQPGEWAEYAIEYIESDREYNTMIITRNLTDSAIEQSECTVVGILSNRLANGVYVYESNVLDVKKLFGSNYTTTLFEESMLMLWDFDDYTVFTAFEEEEMIAVAVMDKELYNVFSAILFGEPEIDNTTLQPATKKSASAFTVDGRSYKLYDSLVSDFGNTTADETPLNLFRNSKLYLHMYNSLTAPLVLSAVGSYESAQICGYSVYAIEGHVNNFQMSNGLTLYHTSDDFIYVLGEPDKIKVQDGETIYKWYADDGIYNIDVSFEMNEDKIGSVTSISVFDFKAYTIDFVLGLAESLFNDSMAMLFDKIDEAINSQQ